VIRVRLRIAAAFIAGAVLLGSQLPAAKTAADQALASSAAWRQWGGPSRDFTVRNSGLADSWPEGGPRTIWSRPLGPGHSSILFDAGLLFTMYRVGNGRARQGPWDAAESVIAMDAATGKTIWEHKYASKIEDFSYGAGPHSTPLIVGDRLFTIGTNKQLFAFDKKSGKVLWSHDLVAEMDAPSLLIRPVVKAGYGCSPIAYGDTIICSVGGPGQSVVAFRQADGGVAWKSGHFLVSEAAPILITVDGRRQLVVFGGGAVHGLNPATGAVLWSHPHDPGNDLNVNTPIFSDTDNILLLSSAYKAGSRAIRLKQNGDVTDTEELWFSNRVRYMFLSALRLGDYVYGTAGDLGPSFLTALNIKTGEMVWQHRGIGRASMLYADGKAILLEEDGDLVMARLTPEGVTVLGQSKLFDTMSWTAPTLIGATLYARDREKLVALDLGARANDLIDSVREVRAPVLPAARALATDLSGTWKLDAARSTVSSATLPGLIKSGAPQVLHVTHAANGTVLVESQINESHARVFKPGSATTTPMWPTGTVTATSHWEGRTLVSEGSQDGGGAKTPLKEVFALGGDSSTLTVTVTFGGPEKSESIFVYTRATSVGSCKTWPTPCKI
jgi:outer membrane protein assembly factor BamB